MARMGRWFKREDVFEATEETGVTAFDLIDKHLLLVSSTVDVQAVQALLRDIVGECDLAGTGEVRLSENVVLSGPYQLTMEDAVDAGVPMPWTVVYSLEAPYQREDPPPRGSDDRDGFAHAFPDGLPWREEGAALHLLVAIARRLHGAVRMAGTLDVVQPDPERAVDLHLHSPYWVNPDVLHGVLTRIFPHAHLAIEGHEWAGPPESAYDGTAVAEETAWDPLTPAELAMLHEKADTFDIDALSTDQLDAYAIIGEITRGGQDGLVELLVHVAEGTEPVVADQDWASKAFITYEARWLPADPAERERRLSDDAFVRSRERAKPVVAALMRAVVEVTGGVVTDEDGFAVDRYAL
jgi:hypothetical protein